jgi:hypothetical protein
VSSDGNAAFLEEPNRQNFILDESDAGEKQLSPFAEI